MLTDSLLEASFQGTFGLLLPWEKLKRETQEMVTFLGRGAAVAVE